MVDNQKKFGEIHATLINDGCDIRYWRRRKLESSEEVKIKTEWKKNFPTLKLKIEKVYFIRFRAKSEIMKRYYK